MNGTVKTLGQVSFFLSSFLHHVSSPSQLELPVQMVGVKVPTELIPSPSLTQVLVLVQAAT